MRKRCGMCNNALALYFMNEGPAPIRRKLERHLRACPACREQAALSEKMLTVCDNLARSRTSADYEELFRRRLEEVETGLASGRPAEGNRGRAVFDRIENLLRSGMMRRPVLALARAAVAAGFIIALSTSLAYFMTPAPCHVILTQGKAEFYDMKRAEWVDAVPGVKLTAGSRIRAVNSGAVDIGVENKYAVRLMYNGVLTLAGLSGTRNGSRAEYALDRGLLLGSTGKGFKGSEITIGTRNGAATVAGTKFMVDARDYGKTTLAVLEGNVAFGGAGPEEITGEAVIVSEGLQSAVSRGRAPEIPQDISAANMPQLRDMYLLGAAPRIAASVEDAEMFGYNGLVVVLIVPNVAGRADRLLKSCVYWTNDRESGAVRRILMESHALTVRAGQNRDTSLYNQAVRKLETLLSRYPDDRYNPQFLLFAGIYYRFLGEREKALDNLQKVVDGYPHTELASIAQYALGVVYQEDLADIEMAEKAYNKVIARYPYSPEAVSARARLISLQ